jgi:hypothetical protein
MCVVIDANKAADFCKQDRPYLKMLLQWVNSGGRIASGGRLEVELFKVQAMKLLLVEWSRSGKLIRVSPHKIIEREALVRDRCVSDDPHVVALAIESKASIVVTGDGNLIKDLKNLELMGSKRKIYKENAAKPNVLKNHRALLQRSDCP